MAQSKMRGKESMNCPRGRIFWGEKGNQFGAKNGCGGFDWSFSFIAPFSLLLN